MDGYVSGWISEVKVLQKPKYTYLTKQTPLVSFSYGMRMTKFHKIYDKLLVKSRIMLSDLSVMKPDKRFGFRRNELSCSNEMCDLTSISLSYFGYFTLQLASFLMNSALFE
jgi:hypothetical protein